MALRIKIVSEYAISNQEKTKIYELLTKSFPDTFNDKNTNTYYKQVPHFRLLAYKDNIIVGQLGLDHRVIRVGNTVIRIIGIIDICVTSNNRLEGIGTALLSKTEQIANMSQVDHLILMADNHNLYKKCGYINIKPANTKWFAIDQKTSLGMIEKDLGDCFLVKNINGKQWPIGKIDLLGYLF